MSEKVTIEDIKNQIQQLFFLGERYNSQNKISEERKRRNLKLQKVRHYNHLHGKTYMDYIEKYVEVEPLQYTVDKLKAEREKYGMSQKDLSEITGIPTETIKKWEQGQQRPSTAQLEMILRMLPQNKNNFHLVNIHTGAIVFTGPKHHMEYMRKNEGYKDHKIEHELYRQRKLGENHKTLGLKLEIISENIDLSDSSYSNNLEM